MEKLSVKFAFIALLAVACGKFCCMKRNKNVLHIFLYNNILVSFL